MRKYSRFKICKTNFNFFFYSSRLVKFNRPKWNALKEKLKFFKKISKNVFAFSKHSLSFLYNIPSVFHTFKYYKSRGLKRRATFFKQKNFSE